MAALAAALALGAACGGCAPWPGTRYVAVVPPGELVHSSCAFNEHVPVGVRMPVGAATALVTVAEHRGRPYLELRLDVPPGTTLRLETDALEVVGRRGAQESRVARFPGISLVDSPIRQLDGPVSAGVRARQLPVDATMTGGHGAPVAPPAAPGASHRHHWLATFLEVAGAQAFEVRLPPIVEDGRVTHRLRAVFEARTVVAVALFNC